MSNALHLAATGGHIHVLKYLMPIFGDSKYDFDGSAQNCLHRAAKEGHKEVVNYLIREHGFDPQLRDSVSPTCPSKLCALVCTIEACSNVYKFHCSQYCSAICELFNISQVYN